MCLQGPYGKGLGMQALRTAESLQAGIVIRWALPICSCGHATDVYVMRVAASFHGQGISVDTMDGSEDTHDFVIRV